MSAKKSSKKSARPSSSTNGAAPSEKDIQVTLHEKRIFKPSTEFQKAAIINDNNYKKIFSQAKSNPQKYWAEAAKELHWFKPWKTVLKWKAPHAEWFIGGKINASYNCLDRHLATQGHRTAILWEGEPGEVVTWTYAQLHHEVEYFTAALRGLGLQKGDRVAIFMPMIPEAAVAMLACARGGFTHTVIFGGFSAEGLKDRIRDAGATLVITADHNYRKGVTFALKGSVDLAVASSPSVKHVVTVKRAQVGSLRNTLKPRRAHPVQRETIKEWDYHDLLGGVTRDDRRKNGSAEVLDSEHPLFILYTSGTTGKPKGIVHSTGGYLTGVLRTVKTVFDLKPGDLYWCTADIGWITGHSYLIYGPLAAGTTIMMFEGALGYPDNNRLWQMIDRHRVNILYTAPTAIRTFMKQGEQFPKAADLSSLRLLGTVGEPINPEAWMWYRKVVGGDRCPIVDTYWQTETGAIMISPLPGAVPAKPGSATKPLPGYDVDVVNKQGKPVPVGSGGYLVVRKPWPSMARTIYGDPERFQKAYFGDFSGGVYFTGDGARKDKDGYIWCLGRVDDVLNVSGHRLGTMEIESALVSHPSVAEAAVVGRPDEIKGQGIVAFVTLNAAATASLGGDAEKLKAVRADLRAHVAKEIGALARPDDIRLTDALPKTRSGKIMRRLLRELATNGEVKGDTSTLEDFTVIASLQKEDD